MTNRYLGLIFRTGGRNWGRISSQNYKEMLDEIRTRIVLKSDTWQTLDRSPAPTKFSVDPSSLWFHACMIRCVYFLLTLSSPSSSLSSSLSQITPHRCCQSGALYSGQSFPCTPLGFSCFTKFDHASISRRLCSPSSPRPPVAINYAPIIPIQWPMIRETVLLILLPFFIFTLALARPAMYM